MRLTCTMTANAEKKGCHRHQILAMHPVVACEV